MSTSARPGQKRRRSRACDEGSVLMLAPAAVLVLVVLGAIAVDFAIVHLAQRELSNATAAAANDAAVAALSEESFYAGGQLRLDETAARAVAETSLVRRGGSDAVAGGITGVAVEVVDGEAIRVTVDAAGVVSLVFSRGLPGAPNVRPVTATSVATAVADEAVP